MLCLVCQSLVLIIRTHRGVISLSDFYDCRLPGRPITARELNWKKTLLRNGDSRELIILPNDYKDGVFPSTKDIQLVKQAFVKVLGSNITPLSVNLIPNTVCYFEITPNVYPFNKWNTITIHTEETDKILRLRVLNTNGVAVFDQNKAPSNGSNSISWDVSSIPIGLERATFQVISGTDCSIKMVAVGYDLTPIDQDVFSMPQIPTPANKMYPIVFHIKNNTGSNIEGAIVDLGLDGLCSTTNGICTINLKQGVYNGEVTATGYNNELFQVTASDNAPVQVISLTPIITSYPVTFQVKNPLGNNIDNATVNLGANGSCTTTNGVCTLNLNPGTYNGNVSSTGYVTQNIQVVVTSSTPTQNISLALVDNTYKTNLEVWCSGTKSTKTATKWDDISGKGNHISWANATISGDEYVCNGTSTLGTVPKPVSFLGGANGSNITILFKFDPKVVNYRGVAGPHYGFGTHGFIFAAHDNGITFGFYPSLTGLNADSLLNLAYNTTNFPNGLTAFHEVSMNYDLNTIAVYVNGVLKGSKVVGGHTFHTDNIIIGKSFGSSDSNPRFLQGAIRDFKLYSSTITGAQILQNYNQNKAEGLVL